jgi:CubicO group peptidase (beta-lactamase class C family)
MQTMHCRIDEEILFQIGSTAKMFRAKMRLVEQRKLKLDEPIRTYLPGFSMADPAVAEGVTTRSPAYAHCRLAR